MSRYLIRIKNSRFLTGSSTKMIHEAKDGKTFIGPSSLATTTGDSVFAECSDYPDQNGHYHIIKVIHIQKAE